MYKVSKSFSDLQPYYPGVIAALWSLSQKRPSPARKKQFWKTLPWQILQMMSGTATICQVCCWVNICYLGKNKQTNKPKTKTKNREKAACPPVDKAGKILLLPLLHIIYTLSGCFNCFCFFSPCIPSPSVNASFYGKNYFALCYLPNSAASCFTCETEISDI